MNNKKFWYSFTAFVVRFRIPVLLVFGVAAMVLGAKVGANINKVDNSLHIWFQDGDPDYAFYNEFKNGFESDEVILVGFQVPEGEKDIFTPRMVRLISEVSDAMEGVRDVEDVSSIVKQNHVRGADGQLIIEPIIDMDEELTLEALDLARKRALDDETFVGFLVSADAKVASIVGRIVSTEDKELKRRIVKDVRDVIGPIEKANPDIHFYYAGSPVFDVAFDDMAVKDGKEFLPITLGLVSLVLFILFRKPSMAILPIILMFSVLNYVWGIYFFMGNTMNMAFQMTGSILVAACIADSVHIIGHYYGASHTRNDKLEAIQETVAEMVRPCFFTSVTTAAGFFSFITSEVKPVEHLGVYAGWGCMLAFVATIMVIPALLSFFPMPSAEKTTRYREGFISTSLERVGNWTERNANAVLGVSAALFVVAIIGIVKVRVEGNVIEYIPKGHWVRQTINFMQERLGGLSSFEVIFEGEPDVAKDPAVLHAVDQLQNKLLEAHDITNSFSHVNYLKDINQTMHDDDENWHRVPDSREMVAQYLLLAETSGDEDISRFVNYDYSRIRISNRTPAMISKHYLEMMDRANTFLAEYVPQGIKATLTGLVPLYGKFDRLILHSQIRSFIGAFFIIFIFMSFLTGNLKIGAISMIPNILPIFATLAIMGYLDLNLDAATVMIAGIALGIAVDDTVHYVSRFKTELERNGWDYHDAMHRVTRIAGRPIVFTSIILFAGFGVLILGSFRPTRLFGALTGTTMVLALMGDLILLPALLLRLKPWGTGPVKETAASIPPEPAEEGSIA